MGFVLVADGIGYQLVPVTSYPFDTARRQRKSTARSILARIPNPPEGASRPERCPPKHPPGEEVSEHGRESNPVHLRSRREQGHSLFRGFNRLYGPAMGRLLIFLVLLPIHIISVGGALLWLFFALLGI